MDAPGSGGFSLWQLLFYPTFSAFGGLLGYVLRALDAGTKVSAWRAVIESSAAGFVGVLVMLACDAMHIGAQWTGVIVGVCGWLGATVSIRMLEKLIRKQLGIADSGASGNEPS